MTATGDNIETNFHLADFDPKLNSWPELNLRYEGKGSADFTSPVGSVTYEFEHSPMLFVVFGFPFLFSVIALVTSVGLFRLCEWARRMILRLATLPVAGSALFLILHHPQDSYGTPFAVRDVSRVIAKVLLLILIPISIWWWVLFTHNTVRSQFRRH
jgi:hypothetical protein